jgi:DNA-binding XRE family transcriptional regulator
MIARCYNKNSTPFKDYGGRGIKVCDQWLNSFDAFVADMGERPSLKHSIERINNDGNYEPSNCKWATMLEQSTNKRPKKLKNIIHYEPIEFDNDFMFEQHLKIGIEIRKARKEQKLTLKQLAEKTGIAFCSINRIEEGKARFIIDFYIKIKVALGIEINL